MRAKYSKPLTSPTGRSSGSGDGILFDKHRNLDTNQTEGHSFVRVHK